MKDKLKKRVLALLLAMAMIIGMLPLEMTKSLAASDLSISTSVGSMMVLSNITVKNVDGTIKESTSNKTTIQLNCAHEEIEVRLNGTKKGGPANMPLSATMKYSINDGASMAFTENGAASGYADITLTPEWNADGIYSAAFKISEPGGGGTYTLEFEAPISSGASVESISLNKNEDSVFVGETTKLIASVMPKEANQKVEWSSSDTSIATVDSEGVVIGKKEGTVTIRATTKGKDAEGKVLSASCKMQVNKVSVTDITMEKTAVIIPVGYAETLYASINPQNATIKDVEWSSSDTSIATVDKNGKVTGIKAGVVTITAKSVDNPALSASCSVEVVTVDVDKVILDRDEIDINIGYSKQLSVTIEPENATNKNVTWSSSDTSVATVDSKGNVTGVNEGTAILTVKAEDNADVFAICEVTVNRVAVTGISLNTTELELFTRDKATLKANVAPDEASEKGVTWSSSNEAIATVDSNGVVTAISEGEAIITAKSVENPSLQAMCNVKVSVLLEKNIATSCGSAGSYDTWLTNINIKGVDVIDAVWNIDKGHAEKDKHILYVLLSEETADDAKIKLAYTLKHSMDRLAGSISAPSEVTLADGEAIVTATTKAYNNNWKGVGRTYEIIFTNKPNHAPEVKTDAVTEVQKAIGETFGINLEDVFNDQDGDVLSYSVIKDGVKEKVDAQFSEVISEAKDKEYVFEATDIWGKTVSHTIVVKVLAANTFEAKMVFPEGIEPTFYIVREISGGTEVLGDELSSIKGETKDGFTEYSVSVPESLEIISVRDALWGGMAFAASDSEIIKFVKVQSEILDIANSNVEATVAVSGVNGNATQGAEGYLLCANADYTFTATPNDTKTYKVGTKTEHISEGAGVCRVTIEVPLNNPITITAPTGAKAQLYVYNKYYNNTEYQSFGVKDNEDGTSTTYFVNTKLPAGGGSYIYRVKYEDYVVKAGYTTKSITVKFDENDPKEDARIDYSTSNQGNKKVAEDSLLLNINGQNNLVMSVGNTKTLKAYRAWEIIPVSYNNWIITPDFTYDIISGDDVVKLTDEKSLSTTDTDWKTITALKEGTAVIEVSYDAIHISGTQDWNGTYGATDPARTGLMVVQVGGHANVDFGIKSFASQGNLEYSQSTPKAWDAEFDTLYFTGDKGELELSPKAKNGTIQKVQVSADKGNSWTTLSENAGTYKAPIAHGNNIIRVITNNGEAYQIVRGYKVEISYIITNDNGNGLVDAGETVRVVFDNLHQPIPKMAGNYNPGYRANSEGDGGTHIRYTFNGETVTGGKTQYEVSSSANHIEVTIPSNTTEESFTLSDGYIATAIIGLTSFADGGDSHRNIPDEGCSTRGSTTTYHTRCILPDIEIQIGEESAPNTAPYVNADAVTEAQIKFGQRYALNPETLFGDNEGNALTFTYFVNGNEKGETDKSFVFSPEEKGEYKLTFVASDGELTAEHTITLNVVADDTTEDNNLVFDIAEADIKGYVTVSFEDNGVRDENAYGLKYPVPLGTIIEATKVPFAEGDSIAAVTIRLLDAMGIGYEYSGSVSSGFYLGAIKDFEVDGILYGTLGQYDAGEGSGWMIASNDWFIDKGASEFAVKDGDEIQWKYTCQLGSDIGDNSWEKVVQEVEKLIEDIGSPITLDSIEKIKKAREAYDELSEFHQSKVSNYNDLLAAEKALETLVKENATDADKEAAAKVDQLIDAIGTVTLDSAKDINDAREAYEALTALQKQLVTKLEQLETAENVLKQLSSISHEDIYRETGEYIASLGTPSVGSIGGEWMAVGLGRGNQGMSDKVAEEYFNNVVKYMESKFEQNAELEKEVRLHRSKSTDNARVILGLTAAGFDATNVNGYNLFQGLDDMEYLKYQGVNGPIWALIALNSHPSYKDELEKVTEEDLINEILAAQLEDGGWDLLGVSADTDMTAMAIQALAPYYGTDETVQNAIDKALEKLSSMQRKDGSFASVDGKNSESTAQVIVALTALGINPEEDARFIKKGMSVVDALCNFAVEGGGFMHMLESELDGMATEQGYYALVAYFRLLNGQTSLYDMQDITLRNGKYPENDKNEVTDEGDERPDEKPSEGIDENSEEFEKEEEKESANGADGKIDELVVETEKEEESTFEELDQEESQENKTEVFDDTTDMVNSSAFMWCAIALAGLMILFLLIFIRRRMNEEK